MVIREVRRQAPAKVAAGLTTGFESTRRIECKTCDRFLGLVPVALIDMTRKTPAIIRGLKFRCSRCKTFTGVGKIA